jgi:hypothetical protein
LHQFAEAAADKKEEAELGDEDRFRFPGKFCSAAKAIEAPPHSTKAASRPRRAMAVGTALHLACSRLRRECSRFTPPIDGLFANPSG